MKTGKKMLAVMLAVVFMMVAGVGLAHAQGTLPSGWLQADLKSGMSLEQAMAKAKEHGLKIEQFVEEAIKAGVKPADVVYLAVRDNKEKVAGIVAAALSLGAKLGDVALSAKSAGASLEDIKFGAQLANVNSDKAASIYNDATLSYSPPADTTSASVTNNYNSSVFTYTVITTGGNTASTKTASPI
ncbi:MAG: hypothetical protein HZB82_04050 [Deltaproteobacteria bacterium]|nr:hypothetical protein [Deltaproteobacteria bacterium]